MSVHISSRVWKLKGMDAPTKLILLKLADHSNDEGCSYPSLARIADETGLGKATICRKLLELEKMGVVNRRKRAEETTLYSLNLDRWPPLSQSGTSPRAGQGVSQSGTTPVPERDTKHHRTVNEPSIMASSPQAEAIILEFQEELPALKESTTETLAESIYKAYPRKEGGRPTALKAITRALKKIPHPKLLAAVEKFALANSATEPKFIPYPATWFNQERWNDHHETTTHDSNPKPAPAWHW